MSESASIECEQLVANKSRESPLEHEHEASLGDLAAFWSGFGPGLRAVARADWFSASRHVLHTRLGLFQSYLCRHLEP